MAKGSQPKGKGPKGAGAPGEKLAAQNRRARFDYAIESTLEVGLALVGSEVKALREGSVNLTDAFALPEKGELWLMNLNIGRYKGTTSYGHEPLRRRRLLLHKRELERLTVKVKERGFALIPLRLYFKGGWAKVELALAKGKAHEDRRQTIRERETKREMSRALRARSR